MRVAGLIQARMGSSRLPGKVMLPLAGVPLVMRIHGRLGQVRGLAGIVLATTTDPRNDEMVALARRHAITVVRWPEENDIVGRLHEAARVMRADAVLKINADCPLTDPLIMHELVERFRQTPGIAFASNKIVPSYPMGYSVELVTTEALAWCNDNLTSPEDRELVIKWIMERPKRFPALSVCAPTDNSDLDLTVDTPDDYALVADLYERLAPADPYFGLDEVLRALGRHAAN